MPNTSIITWSFDNRSVKLIKNGKRFILLGLHNLGQQQNLYFWVKKSATAATMNMRKQKAFKIIQMKHLNVDMDLFEHLQSVSCRMIIKSMSHWQCFVCTCRLAGQYSTGKKWILFCKDTTKIDLQNLLLGNSILFTINILHPIGLALVHLVVLYFQIDILYLHTQGTFVMGALA